MKFWNNLKLYPKLLLIYTLGAVLPIFLVGTCLITQIWNVSFQNTMSVSLASLVQLQTNYVSYLESCADTTKRIARNPNIVNYINTRYTSDFEAIRDFQNIVMPLTRANEIISHPPRLRIFSNNTSIYFSQEMNHSLTELSSEDWYTPMEETPQNGLNWASTRTLTKTDYGPGIVCYTPIYTSANEESIQHVGAMFFEESPLYNFMLTESFFGNRVFLVDGTGHIITSTERDFLLKDFDSLGLSVPLSSLETGLSLQYQEENYFCQVKPLQSTEPTLNSWTLVRLMPAKEIYHSVIQAVVPSLLLCLLCLMAGLLLILMTAGSIRKRVSRLINSMHEVMDSGFEKTLIPTGKDEISDIERNFASVAQQTNHLIHEVYEAKITAAELQASKKEAQLLALRSQINPHYLFNTLESIRMNLLISGERDTAHIIRLFADSFRECIENSDKTATLEQEIHFLDRYFTIQEYRMRGKISLKTKISDDVMDCCIPKLLLQPLVENAIYHGLELKEGSGSICLSAWEYAQVLWITITDDGIGMTKERLAMLRQYLEQPHDVPSMGECLALRNVNSRLRLMYGNDYGIEIDSIPGRGTGLKLHLPAIHENKKGI